MNYTWDWIKYGNEQRQSARPVRYAKMEEETGVWLIWNSGVTNGASTYRLSRWRNKTLRLGTGFRTNFKFQTNLKIICLIGSCWLAAKTKFAKFARVYSISVQTWPPMNPRWMYLWVTFIKWSSYQLQTGALLFKIILLDNLENFQRVAREKPTNERNVLIIINALFQQKLRYFRTTTTYSCSYMCYYTRT